MSRLRRPERGERRTIHAPAAGGWETGPSPGHMPGDGNAPNENCCATKSVHLVTQQSLTRDSATRPAVVGYGAEPPDNCSARCSASSSRPSASP